jgi:hypothetical protein
MLRQCHLVLMLCVWLTGFSGQAYSQEDRVIAGETCMGYLQYAVWAGHVQVDSADLRNDLINGTVSALVMPRQQPPAGNVVRECFHGQTTFSDRKVSKDDLDRLLRFAMTQIHNDKSVVALTQQPQFADDAKFQALVVDIQKLAKDKQETAMRYYGALLSKSLPDQDKKQLTGMAAKFIRSYQTFLDKQMTDKLQNPEVSKKLKEGEPYVIGPADLSLRDLKNLKKENVKEIDIQGQKYRVAPSGGNLVVVPQPKVSGTEPPHDNGWQKLNLKADLQSKQFH